MHLAMLQFNELFRQSSLLSKSMEFLMDYLKCVRNTLDVKLNNTIHKLLSTYMCIKMLVYSVQLGLLIGVIGNYAYYMVTAHGGIFVVGGTSVPLY